MSLQSFDDLLVQDKLLQLFTLTKIQNYVRESDFAFYQALGNSRYIYIAAGPAYYVVHPQKGITICLFF